MFFLLTLDIVQEKQPPPPSPTTLAAPGQWIQGDLTGRNEPLNRSAISVIACVSCGDASVRKSDDFKVPGGLLPFLEKCCCRQNESLLSKQRLWPIRRHFGPTCFRGNVSSHFNYSLNLGFNCHKCLVPRFCITFTYQTSTAVIPVSLLSPEAGAGFLQRI